MCHLGAVALSALALSALALSALAGGCSREGGRAEPSALPSTAMRAPLESTPTTSPTATPAPAPAPTSDTAAEVARLRAGLIAELRRGGLVTDPQVLAALEATPRHLFAPGVSLVDAYRDEPQPIGLDQTISQPTVVGMMTQALELTGRETVLEIGTGSGYQAAVLSRLAKRVFTIELLAGLGDPARERLARLGHGNVEVRVGDGYAGWPERAPFDRIVVTAAPPTMPKALTDQLAEGGILVAPVGEQGGVQRLLRIRKRQGALLREDLGAVRFVPMVEGAPRR